MEWSRGEMARTTEPRQTTTMRSQPSLGRTMVGRYLQMLVEYTQ